MNEPGTDLVFATASLQDRMQWSKAIAGAGNLVPAGFRDGPNANPAKILLAVEYGAMLGLHPMAALSGIHVLDGKPTLSAALMSSLVHKAHHKLRVTNSGSISAGDYTVTATLIRVDDPSHPFTDTWDIDRAIRAELWGKGNWKKYPETQMQWRCISGVTKLGAPEVLLGVWHTPDELGAAVDADGDVIEDAEIVEVDHDPNSGKMSARGHASEAEVSTRLESDATPAGAPRRGRSRPQDAAAGPALPTQPDTRGKQAVHDEWASRIDTTADLDALIRLHTEAEKRGVLDTASRSGKTVEDVFLAKRDELKMPIVQPAVEYDDEDALPF